MKRFITAICAMAVVAALVTGCGTAATPSSTPVAEPAEPSEKLIVGIDDQFPPMGFRNDKNEIVGFDVDLATEVGKRLGIEVELVPIDWSTKELELNSGKVNVLWNGLSITDARKETMLMSPAYIMNAQVVVVGTESGIALVADLAGKKVAMQDGSSAQGAYAKCEASGKEAELITAPENITLFQDLKIGRIDAVVIDKIVADYYISANGEGKLVLLTDELTAEEYGFAFKKDNTAFAEKVMAEVQKMMDDGTAAKISEKWFGENRLVFSYK